SATSQSSRAGVADLLSTAPTALSIRGRASAARRQSRGSNDLRSWASWISRETIPGRSFGVAGRIGGGMIGLREEDEASADARRDQSASAAAVSACRRGTRILGKSIARNFSPKNGPRQRWIH